MAQMKNEVAVEGREIVVGVKGSLISFEFHCKSDYEAQVLYMDIQERLRAGFDVNVLLKGKQGG